MKRLLAVILVAMTSWPVLAQPTPDLGPIMGPIDEVAGTVVPPAVDAVYTATGQNITREDVRLFADINFTSGGVGVLGLLLGSGKAQVEASISVRGELRVISSDRIRQVVEGNNAYNISAENATWMSDLFIPAEVFRVSLAAEVVAAFQEGQEKALIDMLGKMVPELEIISIEMAWSNVHPYDALTDLSLTEPPIVVELDAKVRYVRVESIPNLLDLYFQGRKPADDPQKEYVARLKEENGDPLKARDFFAAAAYTQLLNVSLQPGWSLDVNLAVPRGYSFEYANRNIDLANERQASVSVDGSQSDGETDEVLLVSMTHRRAVVVAIFAALSLLIAVIGMPARYAYVRWRLPRLARGGTKKRAPTAS